MDGTTLGLYDDNNLFPRTYRCEFEKDLGRFYKNMDRLNNSNFVK